MKEPFRIGDHQFIDSSETAPLSRVNRKNRKPIANAQPPGFLAGFVREPATSEASSVLAKGTFCGHGEPTFTVFDIVIGGHERLDVATSFIMEDEDEGDDDEEGRDAALVMVRPCGTKGPWLVVFSEEWRDESGDLYPPDEPDLRELDEDDEADVMEVAQPALISIGFEYPPDADALGEFSWLAIDAWPDDNEGDPYVLVSTETR